MIAVFLKKTAAIKTTAVFNYLHDVDLKHCFMKEKT